jgi:ketosteroid isomerase-like protein
MSPSELFRSFWDAYTQGRVDDVRRMLHPDVEWRPSILGDVYHGPEDLERWLMTLRREWKTMTVVYKDMREVADDCVIAFGRVTAFGYGGDQRVDADVAWVAEFEDGLLLRARAFVDGDEALQYVSDRRRALA